MGPGTRVCVDATAPLVTPGWLGGPDEIRRDGVHTWLKDGEPEKSTLAKDLSDGPRALGSAASFQGIPEGITRGLRVGLQRRSLSRYL